MVTLSTGHIGIAIKDFLEGREIEGEPPSRMNPFADEKYYVEHVDISDPHNPRIFTSAGMFKLIILKEGSPESYAPPQPKQLPKTITGTLLWKPGDKTSDDSSD